MNRLPVTEAVEALRRAHELADLPLSEWSAADDAFLASPAGMAALDLLGAAESIPSPRR